MIQDARARKPREKMLGILSGSRSGEGFRAGKIQYSSLVPAAFLSSFLSPTLFCCVTQSS